MKFWSQMREMPRDLWILFVTTLINRLGSMVLPFMVLYFTRELHFSVPQAGFLLALYGVGAMITAPLSGMLCDRFGADRILKISLFLSSIFLCAFPLVTSLAGVVVMTLLLAITSEMFRPASATLVTTSVQPEQRKTAFALFRQAINLGMSFGPALGGFLAGISFFYIFLIDGLTSLAGGIIVVAGLQKRARQTETHKTETPAPENSGFAWKDPAFMYFLIALLPIVITFFQHISTMPLYMVQDLKLSEAKYGLSFTFNTILVILLEVPLNIYTSHWNFRRSLSLGSLLIALGFGGLVLATNFLTVLITVVVWTFGEMIFLPGCAAYVADIAPQNRQGQYMGFYTMAFSIAFTFGPWFGTVLMEKYGAATMWILMLLLGLVSTVLLSRIKLPGANVSHP
ncbi:MFS transporter [bacterium]|nr:MFS transporter [bacterium]